MSTTLYGVTKKCGSYPNQHFLKRKTCKPQKFKNGGFFGNIKKQCTLSSERYKEMAEIQISPPERHLESLNG
jgi:hypothetical protein